MSGPPVVDVHVHLAETAAIGTWSKDAYDIWEYGPKTDVAFSDGTGELADLLSRMDTGGIDHAVVVNATSVDELRGRWLAGIDVAWNGSELEGAIREDAPPLGARLIAFNAWLVDRVRDVPRVTPFVAVDPWLLTIDELATHLKDMRRRGARGVKLHPVDQRCYPSDPRLLRIWRVCADLGLTVLSHSGSARGEHAFAEPRAFAEVLRAVPGIRLVLAHLGGGSWTQTLDLARSFPEVAFDLSEIVSWVDAPRAPSPVELVALIRDIGVERVMFGSDSPWYDPGRTAVAVRRLPGLTEGELAAILGENAVRILGLAV